MLLAAVAGVEVPAAAVVESLAVPVPFPIPAFPILPFQVPTFEFNNTPLPTVPVVLVGPPVVPLLTLTALAVVVAAGTLVLPPPPPAPPPRLLPTAGWLDKESSGQSIMLVAPGNIFPGCSAPFILLGPTTPPGRPWVPGILEKVLLMLVEPFAVLGGLVDEEEEERREEGVEDTEVVGGIFGVSKAVLAAVCEERAAAS